MQSSLDTANRRAKHCVWTLPRRTRGLDTQKFRITVCRMSFPALYTDFTPRSHPQSRFATFSSPSVVRKIMHTELIPRSRKRILFVSLRSTGRKHSSSRGIYAKKEKKQNVAGVIFRYLYCFRMISQTNIIISLKKSNKI